MVPITHSDIFKKKDPENRILLFCLFDEIIFR